MGNTRLDLSRSTRKRINLGFVIYLFGLFFFLLVGRLAGIAHKSSVTGINVGGGFGARQIWVEAVGVETRRRLASRSILAAHAAYIKAKIHRKPVPNGRTASTRYTRLLSLELFPRINEKKRTRE